MGYFCHKSKKMDRKLIAQRLTKMRICRNLSLTYIAEMLEITRATVYKLESGNIDTLLKYLPRLAEEYGCSEEYLLLGYEPEQSYVSVSEAKEDYAMKLDSYRENEERLSQEIKRLNKEIKTRDMLIEALRENHTNDLEKIGRLTSIIAQKKGND